MIAISRPLYPDYGVRRMRKLWGAAWRRLVDSVTSLSPVHRKAMAFTLMMRRMHAHTRTEGSGLCAEPGCALCANDALAHFAGSERDLLEEYYRTLDEVNGFLAQQRRVAAAARVAAC